MDSYELNKILGWVLFTCMATLGLNITAEAVFTPPKPAKPGYEITVPEEAGQSAAAEGASPGGAVEPVGPLLASADTGRGQAASKVCVTCHTFGKGEANKVGPNLYGVLGSPKARVAGFNYSGPLKAKGGDWNYEELNAFIQNPKAHIPGTIMAFAGIPQAGERADLLAYMRTLADAPAPLPTP